MCDLNTVYVAQVMRATVIRSSLAGGHSLMEYGAALPINCLLVGVCIDDTLVARIC